MKIILFSLFGILLLSCDNNQSSTTDTVTDNVIEELVNSTSPELSNDEKLMQRAKEVLLTLKGKDLNEFKSYIHPTKGIRFTPYSTVDTINDIQLQRNEFLSNGEEEVTNWGAYDGSGEPILLNAEDYFEQFVYNADFVNAEEHSINKTMGSGNSLVNHHLIYVDIPFTNHYFSGFEPEYDGMDWTFPFAVF